MALFGAGLRVCYALTIGRTVRLGSDSIWYLLSGNQIWGGYGYVDPSALVAHGQRVATANFPPLYPSLVALAHGAGLGSERGLQLTGAGVGALTVLLAGLLGRRVGGVGLGLLVALLTAAWPSLIAADGSVMSESLAVPLVLGAVLTIDWARNSTAAWRWCLCGVPLALAASTRSELPLLALVLMLLVVVTGGPGRRHRLLLGLLTLAVTAGLMLPWTSSRIAALGGEAVLPTNGAKTLAGANCYDTYYGKDLGGWQFGCVSLATRGANDEPLQTTRARDAGITYARQHLDRLPLVVAARELRTFGLWSPQVLDRAEVQESRDASWQRMSWWVTILATPLMAAGCFTLWRRRPVVLGPLITVVLVAALAYGSQRLRLTAEPILILALAVSVQGLLRTQAPASPRSNTFL